MGSAWATWYMKNAYTNDKLKIYVMKIWKMHVVCDITMIYDIWCHRSCYGWQKMHGNYIL